MRQTYPPDTASGSGRTTCSWHTCQLQLSHAVQAATRAGAHGCQTQQMRPPACLPKGCHACHPIPPPCPPSHPSLVASVRCLRHHSVTAAQQQSVADSIARSSELGAHAQANPPPPQRDTCHQWSPPTPAHRHCIHKSCSASCVLIACGQSKTYTPTPHTCHHTPPTDRQRCHPNQCATTDRAWPWGPAQHPP